MNILKALQIFDQETIPCGAENEHTYDWERSPRYFLNLSQAAGEAVYGNRIPWNFRGEIVQPRSKMDTVSIRLFCEWMHESLSCQAVFRMLNATVGNGGMHSPTMGVNPYFVWKRFPDIKALDKSLWACHKLANKLYKTLVKKLGFEASMKVSWKAIMIGVFLSPESTEDAAKIAAIFTMFGSVCDTERGMCFIFLNQYPVVSSGFCKQKNAILEVYKWVESANVSHDSTDGVECKLINKPVVKLGLSYQLGVVGTQSGFFDVVVLTRFKEKSYHSINHKYIPFLKEREWIIRQETRKAIEKIKIKIDKEKQEVNFLKFFEAESVTNIVYIDDSYKAGNCKSGTEQFLKEIGWAGKSIVPAYALKHYLHNSMVMNTVKVAFQSQN